MKIILAIGTGSFIGGIFRYLLSKFIQTKFLSTFPFGTMIVNIIGCFIIGLLYGVSNKGNLTQEWQMFLATGLIGSFTTFSAFSNETISMLSNGQILNALIYVFLSVLIGLVVTFIGIILMKFF